MGEVAAPGPSWPTVLRNPEFQTKIKNAKVLCVGAGGIGCELLKTLVCSGFQNIEVVDLDTIETSNLNRQFLFRKHHVGQSKARTAAEVVRTFKPAATIVAHHANVKESQFGVDYIKGFDLVLNGLDNLEARRHVNRLVMAGSVPLVESGTAGYLGQVTVHVKGETECFECSPKPVPKSFPICTLRNTPDKPIHCVVWAKDLLFGRLFGKPEDVTDLDEGAKSKEEAGEGEGGEEDAAPEHKDDPSIFLRKEGESAVEYGARIFEHVYTADIERLAAITDMWKKRAPPAPLRLAEVVPEGVSGLAGHTGPSASRALGLTNPNSKWSTADSARVFITAIAMYHEQRPDQLGAAVFDKDDDLAVDFVTAASNLRATCYDISTQSLFDAKGMAGNIIHAIATTNAIISGLIVTEALKMLAGAKAALRATYLFDAPSSKRLLAPNMPERPKAGCMACGRAVVSLRANTETMTLGTLVSAVLKKRLAVNVPMLLSGEFMYEEGEGLEEDEVESYSRMLHQPLSKLPGGGLKSGSILHVTDESQAFSVDLVIEHQDEFDEETEPDGWMLSGSASPSEPPTTATTGGEGGISGAMASAPGHAHPHAHAGAHPKKVHKERVEDADGALVMSSDEEDEAAPAAAAAGSKRKREDDGEEGFTGAGDAGAKRAKAGAEGNGHAQGAGGKNADDDEIVILDD